MAEQTPYLIVMEKTLAANGGDTLQFQGSTQETFILKEFVFVATGAFNVSGIRIGTSRNLTNANQSIEIPSTALQNGASANRSLRELMVGQRISGGEIFSMDIEDTSGAQNTVTFVWNAIRETG